MKAPKLSAIPKSMGVRALIFMILLSACYDSSKRTRDAIEKLIEETSLQAPSFSTDSYGDRDYEDEGLSDLPASFYVPAKLDSSRVLILSETTADSTKKAIGENIL